MIHWSNWSTWVFIVTLNEDATLLSCSAQIPDTSTIIIYLHTENEVRQGGKSPLWLQHYWANVGWHIIGPGTQPQRTPKETGKGSDSIPQSWHPHHDWGSHLWGWSCSSVRTTSYSLQRKNHPQSLEISTLVQLNNVVRPQGVINMNVYCKCLSPNMVQRNSSLRWTGGWGILSAGGDITSQIYSSSVIITRPTDVQLFYGIEEQGEEEGRDEESSWSLAGPSTYMCILFNTLYSNSNRPLHLPWSCRWEQHRGWRIQRIPWRRISH